MQIYHNKCFVSPFDRIIAFNTDEFKEAFKRIEEYRKNGLHLFGYIRYEAKDVFLGMEVSLSNPLLCFEVYETFSQFTPYTPQNHINIYSEAEITFAQYKQALGTIKNHIAKGDTYEVNYTYPYKVYTNANSLELYGYLTSKQPTNYNAFIINEWDEIISCSPELFFRLKNNTITTKPMKGTIARGKTEQDDIDNINFLKNDTKNQAENIMIVDLLRNDLSKLAKTGTVKVDKLFEIETHETLHQMTSEVSAELKDNTTLYDIFDAIFPCGSITGAPKISTMNIIKETEYFPRNIYCGAIGYISKDDVEFSVPIRILQKNKKNNDNFYRYYTGGAIVWDSDIEGEWQETVIKKKVLESDIEFQLIETVLIKDGEVKFYDYHKQRLEQAAKDCEFKFEQDSFIFDTSQDCIGRFLLSKNGDFRIEYRNLCEINTNKIKISENRINSKNRFLYYKTTFRAWYEDILQDYFDVIFFNERDELTEGTRSNIVLQLNGKLYTPPIKCGILNGVYRQYMLDNNLLEEKILYKEDLEKAEKIYCINSVRGMREVEL